MLVLYVPSQHYECLQYPMQEVMDWTLLLIACVQLECVDSVFHRYEIYTLKFKLHDCGFVQLETYTCS